MRPSPCFSIGPSHLSKASTPRLSMPLLAKHLSPPVRLRLSLKKRFPCLRRPLHLAPPFLLDDHIPRYQLLSAVEASKKRSTAHAHPRDCHLCPRLCGVNRYERTGACLIGAETVTANVIAPHFGEEPCVEYKDITDPDQSFSPVATCAASSVRTTT